MKRTRETGAGESVSRIGEFGLIERILSKFAVGDRRSVLVGPGDDAAVLACGRGSRLVLTTDMLVEGTHFRLEWSCPETVGFKAVTANLSDVAAMGGAPVGIVVSLGVPASVPTRAVDGLYRGISTALRRFGGDLLGGDTVRSERITVSVAAVGILVGDEPLLRSGARTGDFVCVTGALGRSELGLLLLKRYVGRSKGSRRSAMLAWADRKMDDFRSGAPAGMRKDAYACIVKHLAPEPRMISAQLLARQGRNGPSSMIDVSDGLSSDLNQLAGASGAHFRIYERRIPVHQSVVRTARRLGVPAMQTAVSSGEEYELILTVPPLRLESLTRLISRGGETRLTVIGEVTEAEARRGRAAYAARKGEVALISRDGRRSALTHRGFRHF